LVTKAEMIDRIEVLEAKCRQLTIMMETALNLGSTANQRVNNVVNALDKALEVIGESIENDHRTARGLHERGAVYRR